MFDDICKPKPEEKPALEKCPHLYYQDECPDFEISENPKVKVCKHLGKLTCYCYKDVERN
jgi:hypothetical protein